VVLAISTTSVEVLKILLFCSYSKCFSRRIPTPVNFIIPKDDKPFASLYFHRRMLLTGVFCAIEIKTDISVISLSKL
jgi:hypothetical protein